jgi:hypothetical protein
MIVKKSVGKAREYKIKTQNLNQHLRADIIIEIRSVATIQLHKLIEGLLINAPDSLFEYMCTVQDQTLMRGYFNVMRGLKLCSRQLISEFDEQMTRAWRALLFGQSIPSLQSIGGKPTEVLTCLSSRAHDRYAPLLEILEIHIAGLLNAEEVFHPLCPDYLFLSFWHATGRLGVNSEERLLIMPLFGRFVTDRLGATLADANDMLLNKLEYDSA